MSSTTSTVCRRTDGNTARAHRCSIHRLLQLRRVSMGAATKTVTDATFDTDVLGSDTPVLVDFWAEWCGPCKMVAPVLEEIASEHAGKITVAKVNIDENPEIARRYQIMSIPTMSVFSSGEVVKSIVGAKPKAALLRDLESFL
jgi:thioredoxin 1